MISGRFDQNGGLFFEIGLVADNDEIFTVEALFDTGFTMGLIAINSQDIEALGWSLIRPSIALQTAKGEEYFDIYQGRVVLADQEFDIIVHVGDEIPEILMGFQWLNIMTLVVNNSRNILTLEISENLSS